MRKARAKKKKPVVSLSTMIASHSAKVHSMEKFREKSVTNQLVAYTFAVIPALYVESTGRVSR